MNCSNCSGSVTELDLVTYLDGVVVACICRNCFQSVHTAKVVLKHNGVRLAYDQYVAMEMLQPSFGKPGE